MGGAITRSIADIGRAGCYAGICGIGAWMGLAAMTEIKAVEIEAELRQIRTMADGSVNVVLNCPEYVMPMVKVMMDWLKDQVHCVIELVSSNTG